MDRKTIQLLIVGVVGVFILSVLFSGGGEESQTPQSQPEQITAVVMAEDFIGKTFDEIVSMIGKATWVDHNDPPIVSHYEWEKENYTLYVEAPKPKSQAKIEYLEITIPGKCLNDYKKALRLFGVSSENIQSPTPVGNTQTWEPFKGYKRLRLWCDDNNQKLKIIP